MKKITWASLLLIFISFPGISQEIELAPVTGTVAIENATIVPRPGESINKGTVLIKDGVILAVGNNVKVPAGARIVKADSMYLYPGFILGSSHAGIKTEEEKQESNQQVKDPGNPPNELAGITPYRKVYQLFDAGESSIGKWREAGFTVANTMPKGGMLPGTSSIILLGGNKQDHIIKDDAGFYSTLDPARRIYPATILGVMAKYRDLFRSAEQTMQYSEAYNADPSGRQRPNKDVVLEAFYPVIRKEMPVYFKAEEILDAQRAMLLEKDLDFNLILTELKQGWDLVDEIKSTGASVQFSLDMPEWKEEKKDSAKTEEISEEKKMLQNRRDEFLKKYYGQMAKFSEANIPFSFSGINVKPQDIQKHLQKIVAQGLSEQNALAALTTVPASQFGLERSIGTVEKGKMANLVISNKPYFEKDSKIKYVMIEGKLYEYDLKEKKEASPEVLDIVSGQWTFTTETPGGNMTGNIVIKKVGENFSGTIYNDITAQESELNNIEISGDNLSFNFDVHYQGQNLNLLANLEISGESFEGFLSMVGQQGSFPIEGSKVPQNRS